MLGRSTFASLLGIAFTAATASLLAQAPAPQGNPLDQPIAWMQEAKRNYAAVRDYTCTLVKRERVNGTLQDENIILMSFKPQPFSVYMKWIAPTKFKGQEVAYVQGRNNNKMRVKAKGILGLADFMSIDVQDRRVLEHSRHTIQEAGMGYLVETTLAGFTKERDLNRTKVNVAEFDFDKRRCYRIETILTNRNPPAYAYRSVLYIEKTSKLPMRTEHYDWPKSSGPQDGELLEMFSFINLQFNQNLTDEFFVK